MFLCSFALSSLSFSFNLWARVVFSIVEFLGMIIEKKQMLQLIY